MCKKTVKHALLSLTILGFVGCSERTILVYPQGNSVQRPVTTPVKRPAIKEEILLGRSSNNTNLGNRVNVPTNNPTLGTALDANLSVPHTENELIERIPFPEEEYRYVKKRGRSTVSGRIYLENSHTSEKVTGDKLKLWLNPVTSYSRQWYQESYLAGYKLSKTDKRLYNYMKFTYSDNAGKFNFYGVPKGEYYLVGTIKCAEECGFSKSKSVRLVREVSVGNGVTTVELMKHVP